MRKSKKTPIDHPELGLPEVRKLWRTEGLFSDHYLKVRIQKNDWWPTDDQARPVWQFCQELYEKRYLACAKNNEAFTRQELIDKILEKIAFPYTVNLGLPEGQRDLEPDYILYSDAETKEQVIDKSAVVRYRASVAILEAKKVNHPLSQISQHQQRYPHQQIRQYLDEAQMISWGILTNGNEWRLYCRDAKPSQFFALNFELAIQSLESFKYFLALFCPGAFIRDAQGKCRLDFVRENALNAQTELEENLRQRVFTLVEILANGFAEHPDNAIPNTSEGRRLLYENCLIFLYRLLFILYAEGRELLPVEPKSRKYYKDLSLARLVSPLKCFADFGSHTRTRLYEDIRELCHLINGTDEAKNKEYRVPRYNGGLFDPDRYPLLEKWRICDAKLAEVLRGLIFAKPTREGSELPLETVDYADLRVQQLGSIYEGLLEHHFVSENGRLTLKTDKAERKATGAYYTPDYIVKYIVEHTIGPLLAQIEQRPEVKAGRQNAFADAVLRLNVLDPAMGSGHFLVEATSYLADQIVYHPTTRFQAEFQKGESQEQTEIAYWRRRVVEACIYGVDINPLAVELAKLSLWLTTIATDQPLNFLDHHLRCGNSLIGARLNQLGSLPRKKGRRDELQIQFTFGPDFKLAVADTIRRIHEIETKASHDVATVKAKEKSWEIDILPRLAPYKKVADLWTNTFFDGPLSEEEYLAAAKEILVAVEESAGQVRETAARYHIKELDKPYFHWELEFPEVFFNEDGAHKENPGFDAVVGNPPYGKFVSQYKRAFVDDFYQTSVGTLDLFALFIERGTTLLHKAAMFGLIIPSGWLTAREYFHLRDFVLSRLQPIQNIHLPYDVFVDAYVDCIIWIAQKQTPQPNAVCLVQRYKTGERISRMPQGGCEFSPVAISTWLSDPSKTMVTEKGAGLWLREWSESDRFTPLEKLIRVSRGITPYEKPRQGDTRQRAVGFFGSLGRYNLKADTFTEVIYDPSLMEYKPPELFKSTRFIVRRIISRQRRIHATLVSNDFVINKSYLVALPLVTNYLPAYLLAILNSKVLSIAFVSRSEIAKRDDFPQLDIATVQEFPFPRIVFTTSPVERKRLAQQGKKVCETGLDKQNPDPALEFVGKQLAADHSDVIHDLLAFLAERMMAMNKEKQETAKKFLTDIKEFHGIDAHSLKPKTRLNEFWKLETSDFFAHLHANVKTLAAQGVRLQEPDEEKVRGRFQKAKNKIVPLEPEIAFTDHLIDQIVYRLYGLTEEEIRIVEER